MHGEEALKKLRDLGFNCQQCGNCCLTVGFELTLSKEEYARWEKSDEVVLSNFGYFYLEDFVDYVPGIDCADLWFHPDTGEELSRCPFLRKKKSNYRCLIYKHRPETCINFPVDKNTGEIDMDRPNTCPEVRRLNSRGS